MKKNFLNPEICKKCGGKCCKAMPGSAYPEDFKEPLFESLLSAFKSGNWAIDWWEGDPREGKEEVDVAYYIRPRTKDNDALFDPSWGGECIFLNNNGCILKPEERPQSCRLLEPQENGECIHHGNIKRGAAIAWLPYTDIILQAAEKTTNRAKYFSNTACKADRTYEIKEMLGCYIS